MYVFWCWQADVYICSSADSWILFSSVKWISLLDLFCSTCVLEFQAYVNGSVVVIT